MVGLAWCAEWFRGAAWARFRAAVIAAAPRGLLGGEVGWRLESAGGSWERFEPGERGGELGDPWPVVLEP
jgi:hypothetical protein